MHPKQITKTENKIKQKTLKAKIELAKFRKEYEIIREIKADYFFHWLNS